MSDNRKRKSVDNSKENIMPANRNGGEFHTPSPRLTDFYPVKRRNSAFKKRLRFDESPTTSSYNNVVQRKTSTTRLSSSSKNDGNKENLADCDDSGIFSDENCSNFSILSTSSLCVSLSSKTKKIGKFTSSSSPPPPCKNRAPFKSKLSSFCKPKKIENLFNDFPQEVSFTIFDFLDVISLGHLALVDAASRNVILNYVKSKKFVDRVKSDLVINQNESCSDVDRLCRTLANVFKRSTMIMPTLERVTIVHSFLFQMTEYSKLDETGAKRWGTFWHKVMRGWEFMECSKAYGHLLNSNNTNGKKLLTTFCNASPGRNSQQEFSLHIFFRWFIFEYPYNKNEDIGYWLSAVLSDFSMYHQAKLLYLIFGPVNLDRTVDWNVMCSTPANVDLAEGFFKKLARCFRLLQSYMPGFWTDDTIVSLVEELTSFPDGWLLDNFAYFLLYCDDKIVTGILSSRVINGRLDEVCYIFHSMCLCVSRTSRNMALMVRYFQKLMFAIPNESLKVRFIKAFAHQSAVRLPVLYNSSGTPNVGVVAEVNAHEQFYGLIFLIVARHFAAHQQSQLAEQ